MEEFFRQKSVAAGVFLLVAVLILGKIIFPGYVLTMDMSFAPDMDFFTVETGSYNLLALLGAMKILSFVLPVWLVQKIVLITLFFSMGFLAWKHLSEKVALSARYAGAFFFIFNPFVYTRFLAGHWMLLFAYALLPPFFSCLARYLKWDFDRRNLRALFLWLFLISLFSLHIFAFAGLIFGMSFFLVFVRRVIFRGTMSFRRAVAPVFWGTVLFILASGFWIVPNILDKSSFVVETFDRQHWEVFATSGEGNNDVLSRVLFLRGFWGERSPWSKQFIWPANNQFTWFISVLLIFIVVEVGFFSGLFRENKRTKTIAMLSLGVAAFIFSSGMGDSVFRGINIWMFENIPFWRGFRDTNKISAFLALVYAYFFSQGVDFLFRSFFWEIRKSGKILKWIMQPLVIFIIFTPIVWIYVMLGGFWKQLNPVWYPESWQEAKVIMDTKQTDGKILFLPWHQYYSLGFSNNILAVNPTRRFFGERIVSSQDMELIRKSNADDISGSESEYVQKLMEREAEISPDDFAQELKSGGINYVLFSQDLSGKDNFQYYFLQSSKIEKIFEKDNLVFYRISQ